MTEPVVIYGIKSCDTMRKARKWLDEHNVAYRFHDYKTQGVDPDHLKKWMERVGWETLLNRAGTTFRKLPEDQKTNLDAAKATALMLAQPSMIKRPVLEAGSVVVGFKPELYAQTFAG
nr:ArsC family reductase [uncultured Acetobacter sp.]